MRILVVGAGAVGGYFGGRLLQASRDVTFLVRPRRAAELAKHGLTIRSRFGDFHRPSPPIVLQEDLARPFDLVLLSCKAYDLDGAMASFAKAVGPATAILPLLNGMRHIDRLAERFGAERVLGGQCTISATLDADGAVVHLNDWHALSFGELEGSPSQRIEAIGTVLLNAGFDARLSGETRQEMWEKWVFIATAAGITCLMRVAVGDYVAAGAADLASELLTECASIAAGQGFPLREQALERAQALLTAAGSPLKASMLRDIEADKPAEGDHASVISSAAPQNRAPFRAADRHAAGEGLRGGTEARRDCRQAVTLAPPGALVYPRPLRRHRKENAPWRRSRRSTGPMR
jgi:2-dehydropantoate 2-reductase